MKIHGTAKGGALSKKDFGVAFGSPDTEVCEWEDVTEIYDQTQESAYTNISYTQWTVTSKFEAGSSQIGETVYSVMMRLRQDASQTGTLTVGYWEPSNDDSKAPNIVFGTMDCSDVTSTNTNYTFSTAGVSATIEENGYIGIYSDTSDSDDIQVRKQGSLLDANIIYRYYNGSSWIESQSSSNYMILTGCVKYCDNFSSDEFTSISTSGSDPDTWGITGGTLTGVYGRDEGIKGMYRQLPTSLSGDFIMRFSYKASMSSRCYGTGSSAYCPYIFIGLSSIKTCDSETAQDFCGMRQYPFVDSPPATCHADNQKPTDATSDINGTWTDALATDQYYVEIKRAGDVVTLTFYDDADYTSVYGTGTITRSGSANNTLDYFVIHNLNLTNAPYGTAYCIIDDLHIWQNRDNTCS